MGGDTQNRFPNSYSRLLNRRSPTLINFCNFVISSLIFGCLFIFYYFFAMYENSNYLLFKSWYILRLFKGLRLLFLSNYPWDTFIHGVRSIPETRILCLEILFG